MSRRRIRSIGDICDEDYYNIYQRNQKVEHFNGLICDECVKSSKQCHVARMFQIMHGKRELLYNKHRFKLYDFPFISSQKINGIIGLRGIGKTTLLRILGGKTKPVINHHFLETNPIYRSYMHMLKSTEPKILFKSQQILPFKSNKLVLNYIKKKNITKKMLLKQDNLNIFDMIHKELNTLAEQETQLLLIWCICVRCPSIILIFPF